MPPLRISAQSCRPHPYPISGGVRIERSNSDLMVVSIVENRASSIAVFAKFIRQLHRSVATVGHIATFVCVDDFCPNKIRQ